MQRLFQVFRQKGEGRVCVFLPFRVAEGQAEVIAFCQLEMEHLELHLGLTES